MRWGCMEIAECWHTCRFGLFGQGLVHDHIACPTSCYSERGRCDRESFVWHWSRRRRVAGPREGDGGSRQDGYVPVGMGPSRQGSRAFPCEL